ncbi:MAG TPA: hypothetical protein DEH78_20060 [Solibacterales bacterium]|nr:hypothetical protein [Bryobacterales bacterium]
MTSTIAALLLLAGGGGQGPSLSSQAEGALKAGRPDAVPLFERALQANPKWKEGWWALGGLHYAAGRPALGWESFARLTALDESNGPAWLMRGLCEADVKDLSSAETSLRRGLQLGVSDAAIASPARYQLAKISTRAGRFEEALSLLVELAQTAKDNPAYIWLSGAAALWKPVLPDEIPAGERELVFLAGQAFWAGASRRDADARAAFQALVTRYPAAPGVHFLAGSFELSSNSDRALAAFRKELEITPGHAGALAALAAEHLKRGEAPKGLPYARTCVERHPGTFGCRVLLGRILAETGDLEGGVRELEAARELNPEDPNARFTLASLYSRQGRIADAARERAEFIRLRKGKSGAN